MLLTCDADTIIGQHHEQKRDVEGHDGTGASIGLVDHEVTVRRGGILVEFPLFCFFPIKSIMPMLCQTCILGEKRDEQRGDPVASQY